MCCGLDQLGIAGPCDFVLPVIMLPVICFPRCYRVQNKRNTPARMELKKYNKYLRRYTLHKVCGGGMCCMSLGCSWFPLTPFASWMRVSHACTALEMCRKSSDVVTAASKLRAPTCIAQEGIQQCLFLLHRLNVGTLQLNMSNMKFCEHTFWALSLLK
jgi:hypothetical protein